MKYFTADTHYYHYGICESTGRPFSNETEMADTIIRNYNQVVKPEDEVFFAGDFALCNDSNKVRDIVSQLKGKKYLILGNHDQMNSFVYVDCGFIQVHTSVTLHGSDTGARIVVNHDPCIACLVRPPSVLICGHVHDLFKRIKNVVNVGVDVWDYAPVSLERVMVELAL